MNIDKAIRIAAWAFGFGGATLLILTIGILPALGVTFLIASCQLWMISAGGKP